MDTLRRIAAETAAERQLKQQKVGAPAGWTRGSVERRWTAAPEMTLLTQSTSSVGMVCGGPHPASLASRPRRRTARRTATPTATPSLLGSSRRMGRMQRCTSAPAARCATAKSSTPTEHAMLDWARPTLMRDPIQQCMAGPAPGSHCGACAPLDPPLLASLAPFCTQLLPWAPQAAHCS